MQQSKRALQQQAIDIRRWRVMECLSTGISNCREIADKLNVADYTTISRDITALTKVSNADMRNHFESLPLELKKGMTGLDLTIRQLTEFIDSDNPKPDRGHWLNAQSLRMQAMKFKMELLDG